MKEMTGQVRTFLLEGFSTLSGLLRGSLRVVRKWPWAILLVTVVVTSAAVDLSLAQPPMYEASIEVLLQQEHGTDEAPSDAIDLQQLTQTMAEALNSPRVLDDVVQQVNSRITPVDFSRENLSVEQIPGTQFIRVDYRDPSPRRAQLVTNALGDVFSEQVVPMLSEQTSSENPNAVTATVWKRAATPDEPVSPDPVRNGLLGLLLGLTLGVGLAFVLEHLEQRRKKAGGFAGYLVSALVALVLVFGVVRPFIGEAFRIPSESMVPTLEVGDRILVNKFVYRFDGPERGDIVVFEGVGGEAATLAKRVVGVAGDEVRVQDGVLFVNGEPQKESYLNKESPDSSSYGPMQVPPNHVFVMGDNRANSSDSRSFGPVPLQNLKGKAFLRFWPVSKIGLL